MKVLLFLRRFVYRLYKRAKMSTQVLPKVYLCKHKQDTSSVPAEFEKCCLTSMGCQGSRMIVGFSYGNGRLDIYPSENGVRLEHPSGCPCRFLTASDVANIPSSSKSRGVNIGVAVIVESSDGHILLTRRASHMRTFPSVWVPPGGHLEAGETLYQAGRRELREETGLDIPEEDLSSTTLGLWESVYPPVISMGLPQRHHIVVYLLARLPEDHQTLQAKLRLQPEEVDAAAWLDEFVATDVAASDDYGQSRKVPQRYFSALVTENGRTQQKKLPLSILMASLPPTGQENVERLSSGTKFALRQWLKFLYPPPPGSLQRGDSLEGVFQMITKAGHQPKKSPFWAE